MADGNQLSEEGNEYLKQYTEYNHTLRAWFVAFGIGGPATLLINDELRGALVSSSAIHCVAAFFLIGAGAQIFIALINKISNWCAYYGEQKPQFKDHWFYNTTSWLLGQFWLDVVMDIITIAAFGAAIWILFTVL